MITGTVPFDLRILRILLPVRKSLDVSMANSEYQTTTRMSPTPVPTEDRTIRTGNDLHLRDAMRVSQYDADLRWSSALLCELADLIHDLFRRGFEPGWRRARVRYRARRDTFAVRMEATHLCRLEWCGCLLMRRDWKSWGWTLLSASNGAR